MRVGPRKLQSQQWGVGNKKVERTRSESENALALERKRVGGMRPRATQLVVEKSRAWLMVQEVKAVEVVASYLLA